MSTVDVRAAGPLDRAVGYVAQVRELGIAVFVVVLTLLFGALQPRFLGVENLTAIVLSISILVIVAAGQLVVIVTRNIDLSVGSILGVAAMVMGMLGRDHPGTPVAVLLAAAVGVGMACGLVNGVLVALLGVPSIIATLGTLAVFRGLTFLVSDNVQVDPEDVPRDVLGLAARSPFGAAWLFWFAALVAVLVWWLTSRTLTGRRCYAIGSSPEAATARGLGVRRHTLGVFVLVGALSGLGGAMYVARYATVNPADAGVGFELTVISAVVIGGANIFGGSGSVLGTLFGCALVGVLANALTVLGVSTYWQSVSAGAIILLAVIVDSLVRRRLDTAQALRRRVRA